MTLEKSWVLKGVYYECCRVEGHCPLWFGRDLWSEPCVSLATFEIKEGHIAGVDMKGIIIMQHSDGIGPKFADISTTGIKEGAVYISDNATAEQRKVLEPFVPTNLTESWVKSLGTKFVKINISRQDRTYHITMPFGEQKFTLTVGGDRKTPIRMENCVETYLSDFKFCNTDVWKYSDYGKNLEFHNTSGDIADFAMQGTL